MFDITEKAKSHHSFYTEQLQKFLFQPSSSARRCVLYGRLAEITGESKVPVQNARDLTFAALKVSVFRLIHKYLPVIRYQQPAAVHSVSRCSSVRIHSRSGLVQSPFRFSRYPRNFLTSFSVFHVACQQLIC